MAITDKTAIENYTLTTIAGSFDTQLAEWIAAAETFINGMTDRQIIGDTADSVNKYDGNGKTKMVIDDFLTVTSVVLDGVDITSTCYFYPANKSPHWRIETDSAFTTGKQNLVITGKRGYCTQSALPTDLKWAATVLVAGIMQHANPSKGDVVSESIGRYSVSYKNTQVSDYQKAIDIIRGYRRIR